MTLYTALITPFNAAGEIDEEGFRHNIHRQREEGVDGLVVLGSTGESHTLSRREQEHLVAMARHECGSLELIVGCGASSTVETLDNLKLYADMGADQALVVSPFFNKPTQEGLFLHFERLAKATPIPIIVYNIPGRTGVNIEAETLKQICRLPNIAGVKDSTGTLLQATELLAERITLFSGDDPLTFPMMCLGAKGVVSVVSNLIPERMKHFVTLCSEDPLAARELQFELMPLFLAVSWETNPIPIKAMMQFSGLPAGKPRLPLTPLSAHLLPELEAILNSLDEAYV